MVRGGDSNSDESGGEVTALPRDYDTWRLSAPEYEQIGTEDGEVCNRYPEPDEDQPRGYRPRRCNGEMQDGSCDICGES